MNDDARAVLIDLVATQPPGFANDHARVEAYLRDLAPGHKTEVRCLVAALEEGVVERLRNGDPAAPVATRVARLGNDLADQLAMRPDAAQWAVESWALALGLAPEPQADGLISGETLKQPRRVDRSGPERAESLPGSPMRVKDTQQEPLWRILRRAWPVVAVAPSGAEMYSTSARFRARPLLLRFLVNALSLLVTVAIVPNVFFANDYRMLWWLLISAVFGLLNAFLKPLLQIVMLPRNQNRHAALIFVSYGLVVVLNNTVLLWTLAWLFTEHFQVRHILWAFAGGLVCGLVAGLFENLLGLTPPIVEGPEAVKAWP